MVWVRERVGGREHHGGHVGQWDVEAGWVEERVRDGCGGEGVAGCLPRCEVWGVEVEGAGEGGGGGEAGGCVEEVVGWGGGVGVVEGEVGEVLLRGWKGVRERGALRERVLQRFREGAGAARFGVAVGFGFAYDGFLHRRNGWAVLSPLAVGGHAAPLQALGELLEDVLTCQCHSLN